MAASHSSPSPDASLSQAEKDFITNLELPAATRRQGLAAVLPAAYAELRRLAGSYLREERAGHTLQATALVHEAYLRLLEQREINPENHAQFVGVAARMMRRILTNHALARSAAKRGGQDAIRLSLDDALDFYQKRDLDVEGVDEALRDLEQLDAEQAQIVELRFFGGLTIEEVSKALSISVAKVKREWATAKLWLRRRLTEAV